MITNPPPEHLLSPQEVAAQLGVTENSVRRWITQGQLEAVRLGESPLPRLRIHPDAIERFVHPVGHDRERDI